MQPISPLQHLAFISLVIVYHLVVIAGIVASDAPGRTAIVTIYCLNLAIYQIQPHRYTPKAKR